MREKTENEKMLSGELCCALDDELGKEHPRVQNILREFNNLPDENRKDVLI